MKLSRLALLGLGLAWIGGSAACSSSSSDVTDAGVLDASPAGGGDEPTPPPDPTNRFGDSPGAAALGKAFFFDATDGKETTPEGAGVGSRNVPSLILAAHARWQLWDGRADSLWMQAVLPMEDPDEFASTRLFVVHAIAARYRAAYESVFGALPPLHLRARFPGEGKPGDAAWEGMTLEDRRSVTRVFVNVGKAIAAYERGLRVRPNALDEYAAGRLDALTAAEKDGLLAFFSAGCAQFLRTGELSDAPSSGPVVRAGSSRAEGAFKTPSLRGVAFTLPFGHGGSFGGLTSVIDAHRTGGQPAGSALAAGELESWVPELDPAAIPSIITFLRSLRLDVEP